MAFFRRDTVRQILVIIATLATIAFNGASQALALNGQTVGDIANRTPLYFLPDNYVFGIWGLIYSAMLAYTIYQALPSQRENPLARSTAYPYIWSCVFNCTWLVAFQFELFSVSELLIVLLLLCLIVINIRAGIGVQRVSMADHWLIHVPFSIYLGWVSVANIANGAYVLYSDFGWRDPVSGQWATFVMLAIGAVLAGVMLLRRNNIAFALVVVWAFFGIYTRHIDVTNAEVSPPADLAAQVAWFALAMSVLVTLAIGAWAVLQRPKIQQRALARSA